MTVVENIIDQNIKLCRCGCGQPTKLYRGKPNQFINGHCHRKNYHHNWKNGRYFENGYIMIMSFDHPFCDKNGYVREHRLVMEKHLGRYLTKDEVVHHINENRQDNRIENLLLFINNSEHLRHERLGKKRGKYKVRRKV